MATSSNFQASKSGELYGGHMIANKGSSCTETKSSVDNPGMESAERSQKSLRLFSFRKKNGTTRLEKRQTEKPLRRLTFKSVALTIQKFLIRVATPNKSSEIEIESVASGLHAEKESSPSNQAGNSEAVGHISSVSSPKPNWNSVFSGIRNHGNTCFLNAVIQCLSHTDLLAKYFVLGSYKEDLKRPRSQIRKSSGHGEVTERLAVLIKSLWTSRYSAEISSGFKSVVGKHGEQYRGTLQHDAQEFLLWLLDAVHEDVNRSSKSKNKSHKVG